MLFPVLAAAVVFVEAAAAVVFVAAAAVVVDFVMPLPPASTAVAVDAVPLVTVTVLVWVTVFGA